MKSYRKELWFETKTRRQLINITPTVEECLRESGIKEGLVLCNAMHITASVFVNDNESGLHQDFEKWLETCPQVPAAYGECRELAAYINWSSIVYPSGHFHWRTYEYAAMTKDECNTADGHFPTASIISYISVRSQLILWSTSMFDICNRCVLSSPSFRNSAGGAKDKQRILLTNSEGGVWYFINRISG